MRYALALTLMLLGGCGYHLVGQGGSGVIPQGVDSASLVLASEETYRPMLLELQALWREREKLPPLYDAPMESGKQHVVLRIEQAAEHFSPIGFDAAGLAVQYRLRLQGELNMYREQSLIWQSGVIAVSADVFAGDNPSVIESERKRLRRQLQKNWVKAAMARLQSGF